MRNHRGSAAGLALLLTSAMAVAAVAVGSDDTPTPTPTPSPKPSPTPAPTPRPQGGQTLAGMAKDTTLKGGGDGTPIVISNENLAEMAEQGSVTSVTRGGTAADGRRPVRQGSDVTIVEPDPEHTDERERYWRNRYRTQVELVTSLQRQVEALDQEIPGLWRDFYSRDDPAYRDGVIKPQLDAALAQRQSLDEQLAAARPRLDEIKDQARRDGGEPGWFRDLPDPPPPLPVKTPGIMQN
jgi:hypothetical protein